MFPRWVQDVNNEPYDIIIVPQSLAHGFCEALNYAHYEDKQWVVKTGPEHTYVVGCEYGYAYRAPDFNDVECPRWALPVEK